jgi:hypothetical protein
MLKRDVIALVLIKYHKMPYLGLFKKQITKLIDFIYFRVVIDKSFITANHSTEFSCISSENFLK